MGMGFYRMDSLRFLTFRVWGEEGDWVVFRRDLGIVYLIIVRRDMGRTDKFERLGYGSSTEGFG